MKLKIILLLLAIIASVFSYIGAAEHFTWWLEAAPVFVGILALVIFRNFQFSNFVYIVIFIRFLILLLGAHYTYAKVPGMDWMNSIFGRERNNYDKIGHFAQGFIPAMVARELLIRTSPLRTGKWLCALIFFSCMGISAIYELIEWAAAEIAGDGSMEFLGTQGDIWDAQKDMALATLGAIMVLAIPRRGRR